MSKKSEEINSNVMKGDNSEMEPKDGENGKKPNYEKSVASKMVEKQPKGKGR